MGYCLFNSSFRQVIPYNYWRLHTNQEDHHYCDGSEYYQTALHIFSHQEKYLFIMKTLKSTFIEIEMRNLGSEKFLSLNCQIFPGYETLKYVL